MIPSNLTITKYTQGNEFLRADTYASYQGYYYEFNGKTYVGKEYSISSVELIKAGSSKVNPLLSNPSTFTYGAISGQNIQSVNIKSIPFIATKEDMSRGYAMRYFVKKVNETLIKETNQSTYKQVQGNSLYQSVEIKYNLRIGFNRYSEYEKQLPGISDFIFSQEIAINNKQDSLKFYNVVEKDLPGQPIISDDPDPKLGRKLEAPNISLISDSELTLVKGPFETNPGNGKVFVDYLAVVKTLADGYKPVGLDVVKPFLLMQKFAAQDGINLVVKSGFRSPWKPIDQMSLPSKEYPKGVRVTADSQVACWNRNGCRPKLTEGVRTPGSGGSCKVSTAYPGTSNHSIAIAFDLNTGGYAGGAVNKPIYQWLIDYAWIFGFRRAVPTEQWHWEYWPGKWQFGGDTDYFQRVTKSNVKYKGMRLDPTPSVNKRVAEIKAALASGNIPKTSNSGGQEPFNIFQQVPNPIGSLLNSIRRG